WAGASAAAPPALIRSAAALARWAGPDRAGLPARVLALTEEVLRAMSLQKLTHVAAVLIASAGLLVLGGGLGLQLYNSAAAEPVRIVAGDAPQKPPVAAGEAPRQPAPARPKPAPTQEPTGRARPRVMQPV